jgi:PmbA protein
MGLAGSSSDGSSRTPLSVARTALERGRRLGVELEVYVEFGRTVAVKTYGREVESVTVAEPRGLGVRAVRDGRMGYAFTADMSPSGLDRVLAEAAAAASATDPDLCVQLPSPPAGPYPQVDGLWRAGVSDMSVDGKIDLVLRAEAAALSCRDIEAVEESVYADSESRIAVASTTGVVAEAEQSFCYLYVFAHAGRDGERQSGLGLSSGREPSELHPEAAGEEAAEKARGLLGARPCATGSYTIVFDREVVAALLSSIVPALSAEAVQKGRSVFADKLGQTVASPLVTLLDDGLVIDGMATNPFDGEGVPQQTTVLLEDGVLRSYLHNSYTARKAGGDTHSTGNAGRGSYRALPSVRASNLVVPGGQGTLEDVFSRVCAGLYVENVSGLHSGVNAVSGEISVGVTGRLIEGGKLGTPVREVTVATDFGHLLGSVSQVAGDARWIPLYGSAYVPSVAVEGIAVSGA